MVLDALRRFLKGMALDRSVDMSFVRSYPPGHYYSPLPRSDEIRRVGPRAWNATDLPQGIDLREAEQLELVHRLARYHDELPFEDGPSDFTRYHYLNEFYSYADAIFLFGMMREFKPRRIIEAGSGYTSCLMLDVDDLFGDGKLELTCIEPNPERLRGLLRKGDPERVRLVEDVVQHVDLELFRRLKANDFLFIDSSHVGKIGSDVLFLLFNVLPVLRPGVIIHFHDVFHPFEYPREWTEGKHLAWNELYFLRSFL